MGVGYRKPCGGVGCRRVGFAACDHAQRPECVRRDPRTLGYGTRRKEGRTVAVAGRTSRECQGAGAASRQKSRRVHREQGDACCGRSAGSCRTDAPTCRRRVDSGGRRTVPKNAGLERGPRTTDRTGGVAAGHRWREAAGGAGNLSRQGRLRPLPCAVRRRWPSRPRFDSA